MKFIFIFAVIKTAADRIDDRLSVLIQLEIDTFNLDKPCSRYSGFFCTLF